MKKTIALLLFLVIALPLGPCDGPMPMVSAAHAVSKSAYKTASGGAPIPLAYSAADTQSLILTGIGGNAKSVEVSFCNGTASVLFVNFDAGSTAPTGSGSTHTSPEVPVAASQCVSPKKFGDKVYVRTATGSTVTSGTYWAISR